MEVFAEYESVAEGLKGRDLLSIADLSSDEVACIFEVALRMKQARVSVFSQRLILPGKVMAMIFEKPSLRTRLSFETGIYQLGGYGIYFTPSDISLGQRESVADVARTIDRMCGMIMARVFEHDKVLELAEHAKSPVINGLSDLEHPCQALADLLTVFEHKKTLKGKKLAFIGDGNNVANSLMLLCAKVGMHFSIGCPTGNEPNQDIINSSLLISTDTGAKIEICNDPVEAVREADVVYTDVWASMGQESESAEREVLFTPYQVNSQLMEQAKPDAIFMHCLPAHRGLEVTSDVIESAQSVVFDEAENRLHAQKAVMALLGQ